MYFLPRRRSFQILPISCPINISSRRRQTLSEISPSVSKCLGVGGSEPRKAYPTLSLPACLSALWRTSSVDKRWARAPHSSQRISFGSLLSNQRRGRRGGGPPHNVTEPVSLFGFFFFGTPEECSTRATPCQ